MLINTASGCENKGFFAVSASLFGMNVYAVEYPTPFKISSIYVSSASNYHFRVESSTGNWHCNNGPKSPAWSYVNEPDSGAKGKMSALLAAYASGKSVALVTEGVTVGANTYCRIVEFRVHD